MIVGATADGEAPTSKLQASWMTTVEGDWETTERGARTTCTATDCRSLVSLYQVRSPEIMVTGRGARLISPSLVDFRNASATTRGNQPGPRPRPSGVASRNSLVQGRIIPSPRR